MVIYHPYLSLSEPPILQRNLASSGIVPSPFSFPSFTNFFCRMRAIALLSLLGIALALPSLKVSTAKKPGHYRILIAEILLPTWLTPVLPPRPLLLPRQHLELSLQ